MNSLVSPKYWLLGIAIALTTLHLHLTWLTHHPNLQEPALLCWAAAWLLLWRQRQRLQFNSQWGASSLGILLIAWVLLRSAAVTGHDSFLRIAPIVSGLGVALLASGFRGWRQYTRVLVVLGFIALPAGSVLAAIDPSHLIASVATTALWYLGYEVSQQGISIILPTGVVDVYQGCAGLNLMLQLVTLAFLYLILFPTTTLQKILVATLAIVVSFIVSCLRVAILAVLYASDRGAFVYWHEGTGSLVFPLLAVLCFGAGCHWLNQSAEAEPFEGQPSEFLG